MELTRQQQLNSKQMQTKPKNNDSYNMEENKEEHAMISHTTTLTNGTDNVSHGPIITSNNTKNYPDKPTIIHFEDGKDQILKYWKHPAKIQMKLDYGFRSIQMTFQDLINLCLENS